MTDAKPLTVQQAIRVIAKGGDVVAIYKTGIFLGRYDVSTDARAAAAQLVADMANTTTILDWATGEHYDF